MYSLYENVFTFLLFLKDILAVGKILRWFFCLLVFSNLKIVLPCLLIDFLLLLLFGWWKGRGHSYLCSPTCTMTSFSGCFKCSLYHCFPAQALVWFFSPFILLRIHQASWIFIGFEKNCSHYFLIYCFGPIFLFYLYKMTYMFGHLILLYTSFCCCLFLSACTSV